MATGLIFCSLMAGMPTTATANVDFVTLCKSLLNIDSYTFAENFGTVGACVSFFTTMPVESCQILKEDGLLSYFGYETQGDCISDVTSS